MGNQSVWGKRDGKKVRITVFRLNGLVGIALDEEPLYVDADVAYSIADQLLDQADEIRR